MWCALIILVSKGLMVIGSPITLPLATSATALSPYKPTPIPLAIIATPSIHAARRCAELTEGAKDELHTFATRAEGGGGITTGAIAGILVGVVAIALLILFLFLRNRRRFSTAGPSHLPQAQGRFSTSPPPYPSPPKAYPSPAHYPALPPYTGPVSHAAPNVASAYVGAGVTPGKGSAEGIGLTYPAAVYPSTSRGFYTARPAKKGVKWGGVGVRITDVGHGRIIM